MPLISSASMDRRLPTGPGMEAYIRRSSHRIDQSYLHRCQTVSHQAPDSIYRGHQGPATQPLRYRTMTSA